MGVGVASRDGGVALRSPVSWALLGLVIQRPSYGYELVQRFERTYGDALELSSPSQIYTALDTLGDKELIELMPAEETPSPQGRQPKPHYRPTGKGVRSYEEWLVGQVSEERRRSRLFARQVAVLSPPMALEVVKSCERACLAEAGGALPADPGSCAEGGLADRLLLEEGRLAIEARLAWLEYARREITALASARPPGP